jgi:hypothetical protein
MEKNIMSKAKLNEVSITGFINRFLDDIRKGTQERFIKQAKDRGVPEAVTSKLIKIEKEVRDLEKFLKDL